MNIEEFKGKKAGKLHKQNQKKETTWKSQFYENQYLIIIKLFELSQVQKLKKLREVITPFGRSGS